MPLYFAYGSNMDVDGMRARAPNSRPLGPARLPRARFIIMQGGYASFMRDPLRTVHGVLWDLALSDVRLLDRYEDIASGLYRKIQQPVLREAGGSARALVYVGGSPAARRTAARLHGKRDRRGARMVAAGSLHQGIVRAGAAHRLRSGGVARAGWFDAIGAGRDRAGAAHGAGRERSPAFLHPVRQALGARSRASA